MALQVQGLVTPVYEPVLTVGATGEVVTEAQNINTALALANRIEFLKVRYTRPWEYASYFEDWTRVEVDGTRLFGDRTWGATSDGSPTPSHDEDLAPTIGTLQVASSSGATSCYYAFGSPAFPFAAVESISARLQVRNIATSGMSVETGLIGDTSPVANAAAGNAIAISFASALSPNWRLRAVAGGTATYADSGVPVVASTWYQVEVRRASPLTWTISVNGSAPVTLSTASAPSDTSSGRLAHRVGLPSSGSNRTVKCDYIFLQAAAGGR